VTRTAIAVLSLLLIAPAGTIAASQVGSTAGTTAEITRDVWVPVAASVANDDIVAMGRVYHPAAVLVTKAGTKPIAAALDGWGKDIVTAKKNGVRASVSFRFASRRDDATTAFETGIFKYSTTDKAGKVTTGYTTMEALLVKHDGAWRIVMEHQLDATTEAAWNALPGGDIR
jgi:ketosteroid isomerase-like protein